MTLHRQEGFMQFTVFNESTKKCNAGQLLNTQFFLRLVTFKRLA